LAPQLPAGERSKAAGEKLPAGVKECMNEEVDWTE